VPGAADLPQRTLSDFTVYFTTFLRKKIHPPRGFSTSSKMFVEKRIENGFRCALAMFSGRIVLNFAILENLRIFQNCLFTEREPLAWRKGFLLRLIL